MNRKASLAKTLTWHPRFVASATLGVLGLLAAGATARAQDTPTMIMLRPEPPKNTKGPYVAPAPLLQADVTQIKIGGKPAPITAWTPLMNGPTGLQLVFLLDSMEQIGVGSQFDDLKTFFAHLPPNVDVAVGYLLQGHVKIEQPFTKDRALAGAALHSQPDAKLAKNDNGSPYACLKDLAGHWPDSDPSKLRAVFMITDGVDRFNNYQGSDQTNPDVDSAAQTLAHAGIAAYSMYYVDPVIPQGRSEGGQLEGQTLLDQLAAGTNGKALYVGQSAPASFDPLLQRFYGILASENVVTVTAKGNGFKTLDVKTSRTDIKVVGPSDVMIGNVMPGKK